MWVVKHILLNTPIPFTVDKPRKVAMLKNSYGLISCLIVYEVLEVNVQAMKMGAALFSIHLEV